MLPVLSTRWRGRRFGERRGTSSAREDEAVTCPVSITSLRWCTLGVRKREVRGRSFVHATTVRRFGSKETVDPEFWLSLNPITKRNEIHGCLPLHLYYPKVPHKRCVNVECLPVVRLYLSFEALQRHLVLFFLRRLFGHSQAQLRDSLFLPPAKGRPAW